MHSSSDCYVIAFNGEIYNHLDLREKLAVGSWKLAEWRGHSDTETLLACFECWGVEETLKRCVGMFALAVWDRRERLLTFARDRMGEKPLYYGWCEKGFFFGSELKALRRYPGFSNTISRDVLTLYLRYSYIPAPYSIYDSIYKLEVGCLLTISLAAMVKTPASVPHAPCRGDGWEMKRYWSLHEQVSEGQSSMIYDEQDALTSLESALKESIQLQSIADVPLGAFLSGGVDSSLIVALREHVTVALSGDGGDELFGGYNRYFWGPGIWNKVSWLPYGIRQKLGQRLRSVKDMDDFYYSLVSEWRNPDDVVIGAKEPATLLTAHSSWPEMNEAEQRMMYLDAMTYLQIFPISRLNTHPPSSNSMHLLLRSPLFRNSVESF